MTTRSTVFFIIGSIDGKFGHISETKTFNEATFDFNTILMEYRRLGKAGVQVSALSFGSWVTFGNQIDKKVAAECMEYAYDNGVNFFDNAEVYAKGESEVVMGEVLKKANWNRDTFLVSSKAFWGGELPNQKGLSRKHLVEACHAAMKRLQVDYLDFYFCHRPDKNTPMEETVWAMNHLIQHRKGALLGHQRMERARSTRSHHGGTHESFDSSEHGTTPIQYVGASKSRSRFFQNFSGLWLRHHLVAFGQRSADWKIQQRHS